MFCCHLVMIQLFYYHMNFIVKAFELSLIIAIIKVKVALVVLCYVARNDIFCIYHYFKYNVDFIRIMIFFYAEFHQLFDCLYGLATVLLLFTLNHIYFHFFIISCYCHFSGLDLMYFNFHFDYINYSGMLHLKMFLNFLLN